MNNLNITFGIIHCSSSPKKNKNFKLTKKAFLCDDNHSFRLQKILERWWNDIKVQVSQLYRINWFEIDLY